MATYARVPARKYPSYSVNDAQGAMAALAENGFCIFDQVASDADLAEGRRLFRRYLLDNKLDETDPKTLGGPAWGRLGDSNTGVVAHSGIGQSDFLWHCRTLPRVRRVFEVLWGTADLITSFDGCGVARNPHAVSPARPRDVLTSGGWFHVDQNGFTHPGFDLYQGLLNFMPSSALTGGTVVVPGSHRDYFSTLFEGEAASLRPKHADFVVLQPCDEDLVADAIQVVLEPGQFLVWDSRTIHCNQGVDETRVDELPRSEDALTRLVAYICMLPRERIRDNDTVQQRRRIAVEQGFTSTHHPIRFRLDERAAAKYQTPGRDSVRWELV